MTAAEQLSEVLANLVRASFNRGQRAAVVKQRFPHMTMDQAVALSAAVDKNVKEQQDAMRAVATLFQQLIDENTQLRHELEKAHRS
jgi:hypothetical protein